MKKQLLLYLFILLSFSPALSQSEELPKIDLNEAKIFMDAFDKKFSKHFYDGDSIALYKMYAKDATFGTVKGEEILKAWGKYIRYSIKNDTRTVVYTPILLNTDNEYLFEVGTYEYKDSTGKAKGKGKYLLVLKKEDGEWKIYKDMGL